MVTDRDVTLPDGRTVSVAEFGDPGGRPVFHFHGAGSCRAEARPFDEAAAKRGLRIIAPDRPGVGRSTELPGRTLQGYTTEVADLADALGIDRFAVSGVSNGGMYAMAAAYFLGDRVSRALPINPTTPADPRVRARLPLASRVSYVMLERMARRGRVPSKPGLPSGILGRLNNDRDVLLTPPGRAWLDAVRSEPMSDLYLLSEITLASQAWGFDHRSITQPVDFLTGEKDAGRRYGEVWVTELPEGKLHIFPGGHSGFVGPHAITTVTDCMATA